MVEGPTGLINKKKKKVKRTESLHRRKKGHEKW